MRRLLLPACLAVCVGCGVAAYPDGPVGTDQNLILPADPNVPGRYVFGPMVAKGFAGTPGRLADLRLAADGTFDLMFGAGCLMQGANGAWAQGTPAVLTLMGRGGWTDDDGNELSVTSVRATHVPARLFTPEGLRVDGADASGRAFSQFWEKAAAR